MGSKSESVLGQSYFREACDTKWGINTNLRPYRENMANSLHPIWNKLVVLLAAKYLQLLVFSDLGGNNVRT